MYNVISPWLALYVFWNFVAFFLMMIDKRRARRGKRRIRGRTFFLCAAAFGAVGIVFGMYVFRHKTKHMTFVFGIPLLCLANLGAYLLWLQG